MEENRLQDIPQFRTLEKNLELRVALQQVDKLKSENVSLQQRVDELQDMLFTDDEHYYPSEMEEGRAVLDEIEAEKHLSSYNFNTEEEAKDVLDKIEKENEQAVLNAEDPNYPTGDDLFKDWTPPSYEDVVDPEFDRGYDMAYDRAIGDIIQYLKSIRNNGEA